MKSISILARFEGSYIKVLIFNYTLCALFMFSHSTVVMAQAPAMPTVAFVSKRDGNAEIYVMNPDGSGQRNLTQHPAEDYDPAWSPDGKQILFSSNRDTDVFDLYLMDADGTNVRKVFETLAYRMNPTWSPDGKRIAYAQGDAQKAKSRGRQGIRFVPQPYLTLYIATPTGDAIEKLIDGFRPTWSPGGREIAFVVGGLEYTPLGIFDLQTRIQKTLLVKEVPWILSPAWSPQGDKLAFVKIDGEFNAQDKLLFRKAMLYIANSDGTGLHQLTKDTEEFSNSPTWSPHGNELIYTAAVRRTGELSLQLFKTDMHGGNSMQLTHEGNNSRPAWFDRSALSVSP